MSQFAWTFPAGKFDDNFETLGAVATKTWTVPTGKKWLILGGNAERDASATFVASLRTAADKLLITLCSFAAHTLHCGFSSAETVTNINQQIAFPAFAVAGQKIIYTWGVAQTSPEITLSILEIDAP